MCFRPAGVEINVNCPKCGKKLPVIGNTILKRCPFCKAEFTQEDYDNFQASLTGGASDAPEMPAAPGMPQAPSAPKAPSAPSAPAAPSAPKSPSL